MSLFSTLATVHTVLYCVHKTLFSCLVFLTFVGTVEAHELAHNLCVTSVCVLMLSRMPRSCLKATSTRFATAFLALSSTPAALSFSFAHSEHLHSSFLRSPVLPGSLRNKFGLLPRTRTSFSKMSTTADETMTTDVAATATSQEPKLSALRTKMEELNLDVYLVPSDDPHLSEYTPDAYKRRAFLTGFGGSAGTAVVTMDEALLWTDSRYVRRHVSLGTHTCAKSNSYHDTSRYLSLDTLTRPPCSWMPNTGR